MKAQISCGMMVAIVSARALVPIATTLLLVGESLASPLALAQTETPQDAATTVFALEWNAPADCPDGPHVRADVLRLAGAPTNASRPLKARASIWSDGHNGWSLSLFTELDGITGERNLSGFSCRSLSEAATLTLALLLNPEAKIETPAEAAPASPAPSPPTKAKPWPRPVWQLGALAGLQAGVLKDLSPSFALSIGMAIGRFSARLVPGFTPPQKLSAQDRPNAGGRVWLVSAAALGCFAALEGWATLTPCFGANLARLQGHGWGALTTRDASVYWTSAELAVLAGLPLGRAISLELWGFGLVPLYKSSVYLNEAGLVSRPASFGFGALAGFAVAFR
jgi:hypothetical protein